MLSVVLDAGEADTGQFHDFGHGQAFLQRFSHFSQVLGIGVLVTTGYCWRIHFGDKMLFLEAC